MSNPLAAYRGVFVTGTDTDVGKTYVSSLLVRELRRNGSDAVGLKPVCSGGREDAEALWEAAGGTVDLDSINPFFYELPLAPLSAGRLSGHVLTLPELVGAVEPVLGAVDFTLVEGVGGWRAPMGEGFDQADWARALDLPVVVVAENRLGALNHTLLTVNAILQTGLPCLGVILNHQQDEHGLAETTNRALLEELLPVPMLGAVLAGAEAVDWSES